MRTVKDNRRYRLHVKCKKLGIELKARLKTIYLDYTKTDDLPPPVLELRNRFNYAVQTEIPSHNSLTT